jgi:hypothetical protein
MGRLRRAFTYKALNKLIQGSAADQTKKAMVDCYAEGFVPMLTVHDELCFSIRDQEQGASDQGKSWRQDYHSRSQAKLIWNSGITGERLDEN